jgi:hypothetical protein
MVVEFEIITDTFAVGKSGRQVLVKRNDKVKKLFDLNEIDVEEFIDIKTGKHIDRYSLVISNNIGFKVDKPYEVVKTMVQNKSIPVLGFMAKSKKYK